MVEDRTYGGWRFLARGSMFVAGLLCGTPVSAVAQFESLLTSVTDINVFTSCWSTPKGVGSPNCGDRLGYGLEVLWELKRYPLSTATQLPDSMNLVGVEKRYPRGAGGRGSAAADSTLKYERIPGGKKAKRELLLELALGYSQFTGLESDDPTYELRGTVREIPSLSLYGSFTGLPGGEFVVPYLGARTGLIRLQNVQIFDSVHTESTVVYSGAAEAFQLGAAIGVGISVPGLPVTASVEASYHQRKFVSVQWTPVGNRVPARFPREFDFSGPSLSFGLQVRVRPPK